MRNVSTIQLLLSKYLMWTFSFPARLQEFVLPWKRMRAYVYACVRTFVCVSRRVVQVLTACINDCTCAGMECMCVCTLPRVLLCSWFLSLAALPMTSHSSGWLPTAGRTCSLLRISFFLLLAICPSLFLQHYPSSIVSFHTVSLCICDNIVLSDDKSTLFFLKFLDFFSHLFPSLPPFFNATSLSLSLCFYLFVSLSFSLPHALLSKQSGLYQDEPQPKQAKQKIWARKSACRRGRIVSCQPANWRCPPSPRTHTKILASQLPPIPPTRRSAKGWHLTWPRGERYGLRG